MAQGPSTDPARAILVGHLPRFLFGSFIGSVALQPREAYEDLFDKVPEPGHQIQADAERISPKYGAAVFGIEARLHADGSYQIQQIAVEVYDMARQSLEVIQA